MWTEGLSRHCANSLPELSSSQHPRADKLNKRQHRGAAPTLFPSCSLHPAQQKRQRSCLSGGAGGKQPARQGHIHRRHGFHPWVGTMSWRRAWLPTPIVFLPGESRGQGDLAATVQGVTESGPTERCLPVDTGAHPGTGSPRLLTLGRSGHQPPRPPPLPPPRCLQVDSCISSPRSLVLALPSAQVNQRPSLQTPELHGMFLAGKGEGVLPGGGRAGQTRGNQGPAGPALGACGLFRPSLPVTDPRPARRVWGSWARGPLGPVGSVRPQQDVVSQPSPRLQAPSSSSQHPTGHPCHPAFLPFPSLTGYSS